ncbi:MAG: multiple sugar transport system ATP-binding protein [Verrucomicrobiota bacterium]|jgi:multiple sugar transport system ATP-binding protein
MARVVLEKISKTYSVPKGEPIEAVRGVSLDVEPGEFVVILGPSGCGKTTVLRLIAGLEDPTSGTMSIDGRSMARVEPHERDVAMVFQQPALYPHMTAFQNMSFGLQLRKVPPAQIEKRVRETAANLGIASLLGRFPKDLSGGESQRVSIGRALVREPKVFLFDEPFANLDAPLRRQLRRDVSKLHEQLRTTMFFVTHDYEEAQELADRIVIMKSGEVQQIGAPQTIAANPANAFVAGFIAAPAR